MMRLALVGFGWMGAQHLAAIEGAPGAPPDPNSSVRIATIVVQNPSKVRDQPLPAGIQIAADYSAVLADPAIDAVLLATPHILHADQAVQAIKAGKHVYIEKPLAMNRHDAVRIVQAANEAGIVLGLGHNHRLNPNRLEVKRLVTSGQLGSITHVEANISHNLFADAGPPEWRALYDNAPAGGLVHMGAHIVDAYIDMFGEIASVFAIACGPIDDAAFEFAATNSVLFKFRNGMTGYLGSSLSTPRNARLQVFGTDGWLEERGEGEVTLVRSGSDPEIRKHPNTNTTRAMVGLFADAAGGGAPYPISTDQMIHGAAVLEAVTRSLESGGTEAVDD